MVKPKVKPKTREILKEQKKSINKLTTEIGKLKRDVRDLTPEFLQRSLEIIRSDSDKLHKRLSIMILKFSVLTEVDYFLREKVPEKLHDYRSLIYFALDNEDEWWFERDNLTLGEWAHEILQINPPK